VVERALVYPPRTQLPPLSPEERKQVIQQSPVYGRYEKALDRESAYEILRGRAAASVQPAPPTPQAQAPAQPAGGNLLGDLAKGAVGFLASREGQRIVRGVLGGLLGGGKRRR
jgi:hypothetical protein